MKRFNNIVSWIFGIVFLSWLLYCFIQLESVMLNTDNLIILISIAIIIILGFAGVYDYILEMIFPHECFCCLEKKRNVHDKGTRILGPRHAYGRHYALVEKKYPLCQECYDKLKDNNTKKVNIDRLMQLKKQLKNDKLANLTKKGQERKTTITKSEEIHSTKYTIDGLELIYQEKELKPNITHEAKYLYAFVKYNDSSWEYSYISNYKEIKVGDYVVVDAIGNNTIAKVSKIEYYTEESAPYPVNKTKVIKMIYRKK